MAEATRERSSPLSGLAGFPDAKTSVRSVASVAANLRKRGVDVPMRRKKKG
jgi:hypothetical protein